MKKYIVWYAFSAMETEGRTDLKEPKIFLARDASEALYKYHCFNAFAIGVEPYDKTLTEHRKSDFNDGGWGFRIAELSASDDNSIETTYSNKYYNEGYNL